MDFVHFAPPPPPTSFAELSRPAPPVLLVTLSRPRTLNCIDRAAHRELDAVWAWLDAAPALRAAVITGAGRAFCAGADLKELQALLDAAAPPGGSPASAAALGAALALPPTGFGGLSMRRGGRNAKPVVAAVNGLCLGGGFEMALNCDLVVAARGAVFGLPEAGIGFAALAGALPRLARALGRQRATELALAGRRYSAAQMHAWGVVNAVVGEKEGEEGGVVGAAVAWAERVAACSPESVAVSRREIVEGCAGADVDEVAGRGMQEWWERFGGGENMREGLSAWKERRTSQWKDSKL